MHACPSRHPCVAVTRIIVLAWPGLRSTFGPPSREGPSACARPSDGTEGSNMRRSLTLAGWAVSASLSWSVAHAEPAPSAPVESANTQDKVETVVFVGRLISIQSIPPVAPVACPSNPDEPCLQTIRADFDSGYIARYRILQRVSGRFDGDDLQFAIYSHRGFPAMALHAQALLFVGREGSDYFLHRYQGYAVHPTADGGWAHCGDVDSRRDGDAPTPGFGPQSFATDFGSAQKLVDDADGIRFPRNAYRVQNDRIVCPRGLALADFYEAVRSGVMKSRGIDLPPFEDTATAR